VSKATPKKKAANTPAKEQKPTQKEEVKVEIK
jgi:hypothetical protein